MIDINLMPVHLRKKKKAAPAVKVPGALKRETWILWLGIFSALMVAFIVVLQILIIHQLVRQQGYNKQMAGMATEKTQVDRVIDEIKQTKNKLSSIEKIVGDREVLWSPKLNELSDILPRGLWLSKLNLQGGVLLINGSALVVNQGDMINVHNFTAALKASPVFQKDFKSVEIELIKSREISGTSVADFTIRGEMNMPKGKK